MLYFSGFVIGFEIIFCVWGCVVVVILLEKIFFVEVFFFFDCGFIGVMLFVSGVFIMYCSGVVMIGGDWKLGMIGEL